jgi:hypothetical protein
MPGDVRSQMVRDFVAMLLATPVVVLLTNPLSESGGLWPSIVRAVVAFAVFYAAIAISRRFRSRA